MSILSFNPVLRKCKVCEQDKLHAYQVSDGKLLRHLEHACTDCIKTLPPIPPGMKRCSDCLTIHDRKGNYYCRLCANAHRRAHHTFEKGRDWALRYLYDISSEEYDLMLFRQAGVCAVCGGQETAVDPRTGKVRSLAVDHDHENNHVRSLLCSGCNALLGGVEHDPVRWKMLKKYMKRHRIEH